MSTSPANLSVLVGKSFACVKITGRANDKQITLFKSNGIAAWDLAVAEKIYALAKQENLGRELAFFSSGK